MRGTEQVLTYAVLDTSDDHAEIHQIRFDA